jgi:hypothetical protein
MAFDYTKPIFDDPVTNASPTTSAGPADVSAPATQPVSEAVIKFRSCRWRKPAEEGSPECCSHRDVLPITGVHGFDPEAWCPECTFFKLRRTPKKRPMDDYRY